MLRIVLVLVCALVWLVMFCISVVRLALCAMVFPAKFMQVEALAMK